MTPKAEGGRESRANPAREKTDKQTVGGTAERRAAQASASGTASTSTSSSTTRSRTAERAARAGARADTGTYLVAAATPLDMRALTGQLEQSGLVRVLRTIEPFDRRRGHLERAEHDERAERAERAGWRAAAEYPPVLVVSTTEEQAALLASAPQLVVEPDSDLGYGATPAQGRGTAWYSAPLGAPPPSQTVQAAFQVTDDGGHALPGAVITIDGPLPTSCVTGTDGKAAAVLPVGTLDAVAALHVRPHDGAWSKTVLRPQLLHGKPTPIECQRLEHTVALAGGQRGKAALFPESAHESWAREALGFERVPPHYMGRGVRVGLVDSGAADRHPDLTGHLDEGRDIVAGDDKTWREDLAGSGTHCATLIVGTSDDTGIVGVAPECDLHVLRVFPEGRVSDLIEALDYCIEQQLDLCQLSLGTAQPSTLLAAKIEQARRAGVLCVAAAGDSGGAVGFPASLPTVLSVGSLGRIGAYPPDSCHAEQLEELPSPEGFFVAASSNTGPGLDLVAPGVAVLGGLPPAGYGAVDGTAAACAHVTALAALVLAHHPDFHTTFRVRGPQRVDHLKALITASCRPVTPTPDSVLRHGAGIPDAAVAVGIAPPRTAMTVYPWAAAPFAGF